MENEDSAPTWGHRTSAFFDPFTPSSNASHRRSLSAADVEVPVHQTNSSLFIASGRDSPRDGHLGDEEYFEWRASHPSSPSCQPPALFTTSIGGGSNSFRIDCRRSIGQGRHSLIFACLDDNTIVCKCAKTDLEAQASVSHECHVYRELMGVRPTDGLMCPVAVGVVEVRGITRPALILPRATSTLHQPPTTPSILPLALHLYTALACLHSAHLAHGDIKPHNIFLVHHEYLLGDFGAAASTKPGQELAPQSPGTTSYQAPELFRDPHPTPAADVYSLAVTLYAVITGREPFGAVSAVRIILAAQQAGFLGCHEELTEHGDPKVRAMWPALKACLEKHPDVRPSAADMVCKLRDIIGW